MTAPYTLYGAPGGGSQIVEVALRLCDAETAYVDLAWEDDWAASPLARVNPLLQVPTLILPDGEVMTESAAILLHLAESYPHTNLAPPVDAPERARFLNVLVILVAAVYPTFTYGDIPPRFVEGDAAAGEKLRRATDARREQLYRGLNTAAETPFFLGSRMSAIDLYLWRMVDWRPRRAWFDTHAPRLAAIADRVGELPAARAARARSPDV